jgi:tetratricopeptide (TPR) repeat protein
LKTLLPVSLAPMGQLIRGDLQPWADRLRRTGETDFTEGPATQTDGMFIGRFGAFLNEVALIATLCGCRGTARRMLERLLEVLPLFSEPEHEPSVRACVIQTVVNVSRLDRAAGRFDISINALKDLDAMVSGRKPFIRGNLRCTPGKVWFADPTNEVGVAAVGVVLTELIKSLFASNQDDAVLRLLEENRLVDPALVLVERETRIASYLRANQSDQASKYCRNWLKEDQRANKHIALAWLAESEHQRGDHRNATICLELIHRSLSMSPELTDKERLATLALLGAVQAVGVLTEGYASQQVEHSRKLAQVAEEIGDVPLQVLFLKGVSSCLHNGEQRNLYALLASHISQSNGYRSGFVPGHSTSLQIPVGAIMDLFSFVRTLFPPRVQRKSLYQSRDRSVAMASCGRFSDAIESASSLLTNAANNQLHVRRRVAINLLISKWSVKCGKLASACEHASNSLALSDHGSGLESICLAHMANLQLSLENYALAEQYCALILENPSADKATIISALNVQGLREKRNGNYRLALSTYFQALKLSIELNRADLAFPLLANINGAAKKLGYRALATRSAKSATVIANTLHLWDSVAVKKLAQFEPIGIIQP